MKDELLTLMFQHDTWQAAIDKANEKGINLTVLKQLAVPQIRVQLYHMILNGQMEIAPSRMAQIPKDQPGEMRTIYICEDVDRIILSIINDCLFKLFPEMIHPQCKSYRSGESCGKTVQDVSREMVKLNGVTHNRHIGNRYDFTKYFDKVDLSAILAVFDKIEQKLGFEKDTEPVMNLLRKFYKSNLVFDLDGNLVSIYSGLKQGVATASFLADAILYELDDFMYRKYKTYWRYSDDLIVLAENTSEITNDINRVISKYGVKLNDRKTKELYCDEFFKFLGFNLCGDKITLSGSRAKKFAKEIVARTIAKPNITPLQAKKNVKQFLYGDGEGYSWATATFSGLQNCNEDIQVLNNFTMDCLRLVETRYYYNQKRKQNGLKPRTIKYGFQHVGGIGVVSNSTTHTLVRGKGSKVKTARHRTEKEINCYMSIGCLLNAYKINKTVYQSVVRII